MTETVGLAKLKSLLFSPSQDEVADPGLKRKRPGSGPSSWGSHWAGQDLGGTVSGFPETHAAAAFGVFVRKGAA